MINCSITKNLQVGEKICFMAGKWPVEGTITEKTPLRVGNIYFKIVLDDGRECRVNHRHLDLVQYE